MTLLVNKYKTLVRPILEYGNLVWGPNYKGDICKLEKIQWKATRMVNSIRHLEYEERLKVLKWPSLNYSRYRGDIYDCSLQYTSYMANTIWIIKTLIF